MRPRNSFLSTRMALARFKAKVPFLTLIPDEIYHRLSPVAWYEPFGVIAAARAELEERLHCFVMTYKLHSPAIAWERQLWVYIHDADLTGEQRALLDGCNDAFWALGIEFHAYTKPLTLRTPPLANPFAHCDPPEETDDNLLPAGVEPDDIPF